MQSAPELPVVAGSIIPGSLTRSLDLIGDPWSLQILRKAFQGLRRFQDFQSSLEIPRQTLMLRLKKLTDNAIFYKKPVKHTRVLYEYHLTPKGRDLYSFILMIWGWHSHWHLDESILPAKLYHRDCGNSIKPVMRCPNCHLRLEPGEVEFQNTSDSPITIEKSARRTRILNELEQMGDDFLAAVVIGDCWSILVLMAILRGVQNYDALQKSLSISTNVLTVRLKSLVSLKLLVQVRATRDRRVYLYTPTEKARDIFPIILSLIDWGDRWLAGYDGPPDLLWHTPCKELFAPEVGCDACDGQVLTGGISLTPLA